MPQYQTPIVDINTAFGSDPLAAQDPTVEKLLAEMEQMGVAGALTASASGGRYTAQDANRLTLAATKGDPRLFPLGTIDLPRYLGWEAEVERCLAAGCVGFRFFAFPYSGYDSMGAMASTVSFERVVERLRAGGRPLIVPATHGGDVTAIARATAAADLPVILTHVGYAGFGELLHAMRRYPHLYCDTSDFRFGEAVETAVREVGAERVLFGSDWPQRSPRLGLSAIRFAEISPAERALILGGNALRLFKLDAGRLPTPQVEAGGGAPYTGPIFDVHGHLGDWRCPVLTHDVPALTAHLDQLGIRYLNVSSSYSIMYDVREGNRQVHEAMRGQKRVRGYVVVNANRLDEACAEMDTYYPDPHWIGAKIHCEHHQTPVESPRMAALFAEMAKRRKPLKIHLSTGPGAFEALVRYARTYPEFQIIKAHGFSVREAELARDVPNLYTDMTGSSRHAVDIIGPQRMLFGSDQDLLDPAWMLATFWQAGFSPVELQAIMYDNAVRLFGE